MTQLVTVDRFCAIEDVHCKRTITFNGPWSFFFAYPSGRRMSSFSSELVSELNSRGFSGVRWEDLVDARLLFSKVCEGIHANAFLMAEVTEPNANVMMEVGYSLAVGRQPILLQNKNRNVWARYLLTNLESCFYRTREDIHEHISKWQAQSSFSLEPNITRQPFLPACCLTGKCYRNFCSFNCRSQV